MRVRRHMGVSAIRALIAVAGLLALPLAAYATTGPTAVPDEASARRISQSAIGRQLRDHCMVGVAQDPVHQELNLLSAMQAGKL